MTAAKLGGLELGRATHDAVRCVAQTANRQSRQNKLATHGFVQMVQQNGQLRAKEEVNQVPELVLLQHMVVVRV